ncbi:uncharacterized protein YbcI [Bacillus pakistanensis]|uniref:Uncharacterized protein YbcI n=1 Tax=Rossellomorea pakistanensis TaxID=992288 RepID=A0ABS2N7Y2_9BACI|nr:DUF2294 domain-containing protein [Bacillus pakistanensis]MBM7583968.1 uncharacterized protein YbcI [Bacillus pakistanensis]
MTKNLEHKISMLIREIRKENIGNGPREINTRIVGPWVICEMKGNLTNVEKFMIESNEGHQMVHEARTTLVKKIYEDTVKVEKLEELVQAKFVSVFTDINIDTDIAMTIYVFDKPIMVNSDNKN